MTLELSRLHRRFAGFQALDDVSLSIAPGEFLALLGPSGSGKTTLLRILAGLDYPDSGSVLNDGENFLAQPARERRIGMVFQHYALFRHLTVIENIAFGLRVRPWRSRPSRGEIRARVDRLLRRVQLEGMGARFPAQLSGGQRQRVALARALAVEPEMLLLDEPFGALDAQVRVTLRRWLRELHEELELTTVFVTHDQEEALEVADRIVVLNRGHVEQVGSPQDVYDHPQTSFVYEFLGAANRLHGNVDASGFVVDGAALPVAISTDFSGPAFAYVRPHDLQLYPQSAGHREGIVVDVRRVVTLGGSVRVELAGREGNLLEAELDREAWRELRLSIGDGVTAVPRALRVFPAQ